MLIIRRNPLTGEEIWQDLTAFRKAPQMAPEQLSPGRTLSEDVPVTEQLDVAAHSYPVQSFKLVQG